MKHDLTEKENLSLLLSKQRRKTEKTLVEWCNCNSGSYNREGLNLMSGLLKHAFAALNTPIREIALPSALQTVRALHLKKHAHAPIQILLGGHYDTVFGSESPFQSCTKIGRGRLRGPGVADMKGGLLILLNSLRNLEESPWAGEIGWEVLLNPDEEIGSMGSKALWEEMASRVKVALLFEPSLPDGSLVSTRKGSLNLTLTSKGKRAHAGRAIEEGCNAITPLLRLLLSIQQLHSENVSVNIGRIEGGETHNIVPEQASAKVNIRMYNSAALERVRKELKTILEHSQNRENARLDIIESSFRPPKEWTRNLEILFKKMQECGSELDIKISAQPSGGVCDGNFIAAKGIPVLDTLGVVGGNLHTEEEYVELESLTTRTALTTLFLCKLAREKEKFLPFIGKFKKESSHAG